MLAAVYVSIHPASSIVVPVRGQPISNTTNHRFNVVVMGCDVLTTDIRNKFPISVLFNIENLAQLCFVRLISEFLCTKVYPEFQWHIETGKAIAI